MAATGMNLCPRTESSVSPDNYNLDLLFEDHLPTETQLQYYRSRDLKRSKIFRFGVGFFDAAACRKRKIIASSINCDHPLKCTDVESDIKNCSSLSSGIASDNQNADTGKEDKLNFYRNWLEQRRTLRRSLDSLGLTEEWLASKSDKTDLERRVLRQILEDKYPKLAVPEPPEDRPLHGRLPRVMPVIQRPSPCAIKVIERFLYEKRIRLIDLFQEVDKKKDWMLTRDDFISAIKQNGIPLSDTDVDDLLVVFDEKATGKLDYRDIALSLKLWRREKKEAKKFRQHEAAPSTSHEDIALHNEFGQVMGFEMLPAAYNVESMESDQHSVSLFTSPSCSADRIDTDDSCTDVVQNELPSRSQYLLNTPDLDLRAESLILSSAEEMADIWHRSHHLLRLRRNHVSKNSTQAIQTGDVGIDNHCTPSTLDSPVAETVNMYRQQQLRTYIDLCRVCSEHGVVLNDKLLRAVFLHPADRPHALLRCHIRQPSSLLFASDYKRGSTTHQNASGKANRIIHHDDRITQLSDKMAMHNAESCDSTMSITPLAHVYSSNHRAHTKPSLIKLSTGSAQITRKIDCWMTFEEYLHLTSGHPAGYKSHVRYRPDESSVWSNRLLDKLRLVLPASDSCIKSSHAVFHNVANIKSCSGGQHLTGLRAWPVNDSGYVQYGVISK